MSGTSCRLSRYRAIQAIAQGLAQNHVTHSKVWVVQASPGKKSYAQVPQSDGADMSTGNISVWPLWFRRWLSTSRCHCSICCAPNPSPGCAQRYMKPPTAASCVTMPKSLLHGGPKACSPPFRCGSPSSLNGIPYDPASGQEALAICARTASHVRR